MEEPIDGTMNMGTFAILPSGSSAIQLEHGMFNPNTGGRSARLVAGRRTDGFRSYSAASYLLSSEITHPANITMFTAIFPLRLKLSFSLRTANPHISSLQNERENPHAPTLVPHPPGVVVTICTPSRQRRLLRSNKNKRNVSFTSLPQK